MIGDMKIRTKLSIIEALLVLGVLIALSVVIFFYQHHHSAQGF